MKFLVEDKQHVYWNPYFGGFLLGLLVIATFYITGRGIGASGAVKSTVVATVSTIAPDHAENSAFYSRYLKGEKGPLNSWLVFQIIGVVAGAFFSGVVNNRLGFRIQHSPKITIKTRVTFVLIGGFLFGMGAQFSRGCTSGGALSGFASFSTGGIFTMLSIFGSAYLFAWFFRKLWI
jgi:uncharacterized membrane protein YedE/YeeE